MTIVWIMIIATALIVLAYHRASLIIWTLSVFLLIVMAVKFNPINASMVIGILLAIAILLPLNVAPWRRRYLSQPLLRFYRRVLPALSRTEREAIAAGTVSWEGDLFRGNPNWHRLLALPAPSLSPEEEAFLNGPVDTLCRMTQDWEITNLRNDLSPEIWSFLKEQGFFGLIIPKEYGGKGFSAYAHSQIIVKTSGRSITLSTTLAVPNSLGPAELLLHYGTEAQKQYYLPRLARGEEIPCFALTSPDAGSDASAMMDYGEIVWGEYQGKKTLGARVTWNKRYITLAPVATVIGLAFKLYDPQHLLGKKEELGITCALIPRKTPGVVIGRRHMPLNAPFQNGPVFGKDVFVPLEWIIGGVEQAGKGWRMLMECLATGRAITLPASTLGGAKVLAYATGAYARIRQQFRLPIGRFEGIEAPLGRIAAFTYMMDAARRLTVAAIDRGESPAVASAIIKYHVTELGRKTVCDGMDIHGGKGICLGPRNYLGASYQSSPIAITVEGANILTRNMIIFGQGAIRCHPYVLGEMEAAHCSDENNALIAFDKVIMKHINFAMSNIVRSLSLALTSSILVHAPRGKTKRYFQHATRFSSAFALLSDVSMLCLGGALKRKENISARLGDILSYLYLISAVLKHYHDQGRKVEDFPLVQFACEYWFFNIQESFSEILENFPRRGIAILLHMLIFPLGKRFRRPKDKLFHQMAQLLMAPTETRERLAEGAFLSNVKENALADVQDALLKTIQAELAEKTVKTLKLEGLIEGHTYLEQAHAARAKGLIDQQQFDMLVQAEEARKKVIAVDDFAAAEIGREEVSFFSHATSSPHAFSGDLHIY